MIDSNVSGGSFKTATNPPNRGTRYDTGARLGTELHKMVHPRPQHGCVLCEATPCWCGYAGPGVCPTVFECRREYSGSESVWRAVA